MTAIRMAPPGPLALAGVGHVAPASGDTSRYKFRLPLALPDAKHESKNSPPSHPLTVLESVEPAI